MNSTVLTQHGAAGNGHSHATGSGTLGSPPTIIGVSVGAAVLVVGAVAAVVARMRRRSAQVVSPGVRGPPNLQTRHVLPGAGSLQSPV